MDEATPFWSPVTRFWMDESDGGRSVGISDLIDAWAPGAVDRLKRMTDDAGRVVVVAEASSVPRLIAGSMVAWLAGHVPLPLWRQTSETIRRAVDEQQAAAIFSNGSLVGSGIANGAAPDGVDYLLPSSGTTRGDVRWIGGSAPRTSARGYAAAPWDGDRVLVDAAPDGLGFATLVETLVAGGEYFCVAPFDVNRWFDVVEAFRPTFVRTVPVHMDWISKSSRFEAVGLSSIRTLHHSSSRLRESVRTAWGDRLGPSRLLETYACKEGLHTTMITGDEWSRHPGSVGLVERETIRLLTPDGRVVQTGAGEIVAQRLDSRREVPLASVTSDGRTFYRTGDLGRIDGDRYLFITSRIGDADRVNGVWVNLSKITGEVLDLQGVEDCSASVARTAGGTEHLVLDVQTANGTDSNELRAAIRQHCRALRIVHSVNIHDAPLPRDASGKIRRPTVRAARPA